MSKAKSMRWQGPAIAVAIALLALIAFLVARGGGDDADRVPLAVVPAQDPAPVAPADPVQDPAEDPAPAQTDLADPAPAQTDLADTDPVPVDDPAGDAVADPAADPDLPPLPAGPSFDLVRVDPQGSTLVAGEASPRAQIEIMVDGDVVDRPAADYTGQFVSMFTLPPADMPRSLTVGERLEDGRLALSDARVLIAPFGLAPDADMADAAPADDVIAEDVIADDKPAEDQIADAGAPPAGDMPDADTPVAQDPVDAPDAPDAAPAPTAPDAAPAPTAPDAVADAAPRAPALLLEQGGQVELVQPAAPVTEDMVGNVTIETISYGPQGKVLLAGRAAMDAFVRLYLNNDFLTTVEVDEDGRWRAELDGIAAGIYTLRVDELSVTGDVLSRFETPFKREAPEQLALLGDTDATPTPDPAPATQAPADASAAPDPDPAPAAPAATPVPADDPDAPRRPQPAPDTRPDVQIVTVQPGLSLWKIATTAYGEGEMYVRVYEANRDQIRDPDLIYPGQVFEIPAAPVKVE